MALTSKHLHDALRTVKDPDLGKDLVTLGMVKDVLLDGNDVSLFANAPGSEKHKLAATRLEALKAKGAANAQTWNGSASEEQYKFLEATFTAAERAGEKVIVLGH